jgi:hypothetical protein
MNNIKQPDALLQKLDVEDQLSCQICTNTYYNPITLLCQHTFCYHCIIDDKILECPICRTKKFIPVDADTKSPHNILSQITDLYYGTDNMQKIGIDVNEYLEEKNLVPEIQKKTEQSLTNMLNNMAIKKKPKKKTIAILSINEDSLPINLNNTYTSPYNNYYNYLSFSKLVIFLGLLSLAAWNVGEFILDVGTLIKTGSNYISIIYNFIRLLTIINILYQYYKNIIIGCY